MIALKVVHIASLLLWCAGLLIMPGLYALRPGVENNAALYRLQRFTRFAYVKAISPAAFVAVASGMALIFVRDLYTPWMGLKLAAVGLLVLLHLRAGYVLLRLYDHGRGYTAWRRFVAVTATASTVLAILWLVLAKPDLDLEALPMWLRQPGALQSLSETMMPIP